MIMPHLSMSPEKMRARTQSVWDSFYSFRAIWDRASVTPNLRARMAFLLVSKLYRQIYANTGIATDSARRKRANNWARWIAVPCRKLFQAKPMPGLRAPGLQPGHTMASAATETFFPLSAPAHAPKSFHVIN
jgi:hypothetical protein